MLLLQKEVVNAVVSLMATAVSSSYDYGSSNYDQFEMSVHSMLCYLNDTKNILSRQPDPSLTFLLQMLSLYDRQ